MTAQRYRVGRWGMAEDAEGEWVAFEDFEVVERERDELIREVRAWACANCNTVFPGGPAYPGLKCVVCPSCGEVGMRPLLAYELEKVERERDELRREVERLRRVEAAASEIIRYEDSGPPELHDWDAKHEALREALRHDDR